MNFDTGCGIKLNRNLEECMDKPKMTRWVILPLDFYRSPLIWVKGRDGISDNRYIGKNDILAIL